MQQSFINGSILGRGNLCLPDEYHFELRLLVVSEKQKKGIYIMRNGNYVLCHK